MWNQKNKRRNRFLQMQLPSYNVDILNEVTQIEFMNIFDVSKFDDCYKNIQPVKSKIRKDGISNLSFGSWGLHKIIKEISSDESHIQMSAMNTLSQLLLDNLELNRSIYQFDIVLRLQNLLLRRRIQKKKCQRLVPVILRCFVILSGSLQASLQMAKRRNLINELFKMVTTEDNNLMASCILANLVQHPQIVDYFIHETSLYTDLCEYLKKNFITLADFNLCNHFLEIYPQLAIDRGFFEFIIHEIPYRHTNQDILIKSLAFLLNCSEGQDKFEKSNGIYILHELLLDDQLETHETVAHALQNATAGSKIILWKCRELWNLPNALIQRAHVKNNDFQQLYCLQTLRQISPLVKKYIRSACFPQIQSIQSNNENVIRVKGELLKWLKSDEINN
ncbi:uncharacterized protein LOC129952691 [Eupeodes corollae]|uniref:uncharacterized protein LOC129952691 n=1 Tax=Eupeodes corollae TaxID=290404 RepID=UPI0024922A4C|nr:uncharacterized protein LOC129952691 [Eupeodes corollae]